MKLGMRLLVVECSRLLNFGIQNLGKEAGGEEISGYWIIF
jgi:hypothetical protein